MTATTPVSIDKLRYGGDDLPDDPLAADLARALRARLEGEVRFDRGNRALYATDASNYRQVPVGVVVPRSIGDIEATVAECRSRGVAVLGRGGGTSLAGQCCNVAVVLDCSKYLDGITSLDPDRRRAAVEPGCVLDDLRDRTEAHHLTFGPDPSTHDRCTIGGMVGNNACGMHAQMAGRTADNIAELEILTYDGLRMRVGPTSEDELEAIIAAGGRRGQIYADLADLADRYADLIRERYPRIPRRVSGFNLDELLPENGFNVARALVGTEGTCALTLEVVGELIHSPPARVLVVLGFPDAVAAGHAVPRVLEHDPIALEGIDAKLIENMEIKGIHTEDIPLLPDGGGWLIVQLGDEDAKGADAAARDLIDAFADRDDVSAKLFENAKEEADLWEIREAGLGATARVPRQPDRWPGWEDSAVPPDRVGDYLADLSALFDRYGYSASLYGHFGQGCIHCRIDFDLVTAEGIATWKRYLDEAADLVVSYGGSLSGEHGDGQARAHLLEKMYGPELVEAFGEFKAIWDPTNHMNPGKVVEPAAVDEHLRLGVDHRPPQLRTHFAFTKDEGSMARATQRCVGVGKCRREDGGVMCPSYMVTKEEAHSTRGRAHLLFEMMDGELAAGDRWRSTEVREALDLCLACKGCASDCPVDVDMATYKAEFMAHHYRGRLRPRPAYAMGLIHWWARAASHAPRLVNAITANRVIAPRLKAAAGLAVERPAPRFATETLAHWFERRDPPAVSPNAPPVMLWPDTFTNYLEPEAGRATVRVLERLGYRVQIPARPLCCGRPLYDYGMLPTAKRLLRQTLVELRPTLEAGTPVVGVEPSCVATFRDELCGLWPEDLDAQRLARQTHTLTELVRREGIEVPTLDAAAIAQHHCHHHAVMGFHDEEAVLSTMGVDLDVLDAGCCGLAGSFGFEAGDKYDISVASGERKLLPAVRSAEDATLVLADGFSCRTQIAHHTDRRGVHVAEVLDVATDPDPAGALRRLRDRTHA